MESRDVWLFPPPRLFVKVWFFGPDRLCSVLRIRTTLSEERGVHETEKWDYLCILEQLFHCCMLT